DEALVLVEADVVERVLRLLLVVLHLPQQDVREGVARGVDPAGRVDDEAVAEAAARLRIADVLEVDAGLEGMGPRDLGHVVQGGDLPGGGVEHGVEPAGIEIEGPGAVPAVGEERWDLVWAL